MRPGHLILVGWLIAWAGFAQAVDLQYLLANGNITGVQQDGDPPIGEVPNHGVVTVAGSASQIVWPVPAGCSVGRSDWSRITDPDNVTLAGGGMALRPGLLFFQTTSPLLTGCHVVTSKRQVKALMDTAIIEASKAQDLVVALAGVNTWKSELCPLTNNNANCVTWRAQADIFNARYPSRVQGATLATDMATLVTDGYQFIDSQCVANPTGPFC